MQRFFSILADAVERFEGTVDKFTGDGIMAVFGAPIAHEDHARRACYAALQMLDDVAEYAAELRRAEGLNFSVRVGVNSGEVVAGAIGAGADRRLHGDRPHGRARAADGGAGRARQGVPDRGHRRAGARLPRARGPRRVRDQGRQPAGPGLRAGRRRRRRARGSTSRASAASPASSAAAGRWRSSRRPSSAPRAARARSWPSSPNPASARAASATSSPNAAARTGSRSSRRRPRRTAQSIPFMPVLQMLRAYFGIGDGDRERIAREKIAGRSLLLDPELRRRPAAALRLPRASPTPTGRCRR